MTTFKYIGFWKRFLAHLIDQLILGFVSSIIIIPVLIFFGIGIFSQFEHSNDLEFRNIALQNPDLSFYEISLMLTLILVLTLFSLLISWLYYSLMESSAKQATVGKMILNIKVTTLNGDRISFGRATGRYFGKFLSGMISGIGYLVMLFNERKQTLHDMLSGCIIIYSNQFELQKILAKSESQNP